jgi:hypothetical protein
MQRRAVRIRYAPRYRRATRTRQLRVRGSVVRRALASLSDLLSVTAGALVALHRRTAVRREVGSLSRVRGRGLALARRVIAEARAFDLNLRARARRMLDRSHSFGAEPIGQVTICKQYEVGGLHGWYE